MDQVPYIDWEQAARIGRKAVHPGPRLAPGHIAEVVDALRDAARKAPVHVAEVSGLGAPEDAHALVVDRAGWIRGMSGSAAVIMAKLGAPSTPASVAERLRGKAIGLQAGAVLAAMASRILGQFDPFVQSPRLLLVAPNVVSIERQLGLSPADFRLWVCLHEQTHQAQFGRAPWLVDHLLGVVGEFVEEPGSAHPDSPDAAAAPSSVDADGDGRERSDTHGGGRPNSFTELLIGPGQRAAFDQVTAIMSLLEGHADVMMDRVGTALLPTLPKIRRAFERHRDRGGWAAVLGRLLGMDLKRAQYRDGAAFCAAVLAKADRDTLNLAFSEPAMLPTLDEIHHPGRWLRRVGS